MADSKLLPCKCGAGARIRYSVPATWVECRRKCGIRTAYYVDDKEQFDPEARRLAIEEWNRVVKKDGRTEYICEN